MSELYHHGIKGMKWGVRRFQDKSGRLTSAGIKRYADDVKTKAVQGAYAVGAKLNPREHTYAVKRAFTKQNDRDIELARMATKETLINGVLTTNQNVIKEIDKNGVLAHKSTKYDNLTDTDIKRFKKYTDAAVYSRAINSYLATGQPAHVAQQANELKQSIGKNKVNNQVVYRSCSMKFSTKGLATKLDSMGEDGMQSMVDDLNRRFKSKTFNESRIYSTSTSPSFAIDTWRKVNPTAAKTYNTYLIINTKNTPGIYADGRTNDGKKLVNTRSNQEVILAPNKMVYKNITWDKERKMFAIHMDAE